MILLFTMMVMLLAANCHAQVMDPLRKANIQKDITYCTVGGVALKMDVYSPKASGPGPYPAVMYVHGGGWQKGSKSSGAGMGVIPELVTRGYVVASIDYRLAPEYKFPAQIEDVKCAVQYLRADAKTYNIDPKRIGAIGGSAGGHLVALLGLTTSKDGFEGKGGYTDQSSAVQAVVDMFGPTDLTTKDFPVRNATVAKNVFGVDDPKSPILKKASPVTYVRKDAPPFLILHGDKDQTVPLHQSQELYDKLKAAGADVTLVVVKNAGHGFVPVGGVIEPSKPNIVYMIANFFDKHLKAGDR